jgi:hypothetical protein
MPLDGMILEIGIVVLQIVDAVKLVRIALIAPNVVMELVTILRLE